VDVLDHRATGDERQRLSGKALRGEAGRDDGDGFVE
jgi:hypothetical protein